MSKIFFHFLLKQLVKTHKKRHHLILTPRSIISLDYVFFKSIVNNLSIERVLLFLDFAALRTYCLSKYYFINFVKSNFGRVYIIVEINLIQWYCTANFKRHYLPQL